MLDAALVQPYGERPWSPDPKPHWDAEIGELRFNGKLCKRFRQKAPNQRAMLDAFEAKGWPDRIINPLTSDKPENLPDQLRETVRGLRDSCKDIWFGLDGAGRGVIWEVKPGPLYDDFTDDELTSDE